jgi:O-antigen ligase
MVVGSTLLLNTQHSTQKSLNFAGAIPWAIKLVPIGWLIGFGGVLPLAAALVVSLSLVGKRRIVISYRTLPFFAFIVVYTLSIVLATVNGSDFERVLASSYNLVIWTTGLLTLLVVQNSFTRKLKVATLKALRNLGLLSGIVSVASLILWLAGMYRLEIPSLIGIAVPDSTVSQLPGLLESSLRLTVFETGFLFGSDVPRVRVFHPYANSLALTSAFSLFAHVGLRRFESGRRFLPGVFLWLLLLAPIILSWSRMTITATFLAGVLLLVMQRLPTLQQCALITAVAAALLLVLSAPLMSTAISIESLPEVRAGSTETRLLLYRETLKRVADKPVIGHGIKSRSGDYKDIPLGSHSTILSALLKSGILGLAPLLLAFGSYLILAIRHIHSHSDFNASAAASVLVLIAWLLVEDLDAPALAAFASFVVLGLLTPLKSASVSD